MELCNLLEVISPCGDYAILRRVGESGSVEIETLVEQSILRARSGHIHKLLVILTDAEYEPPSVTTRYFAVRRWAQAARGSVIVAMVVGPERIDKTHFGSLVAANVNFKLRFFTSAEEAITWLQSPAPTVSVASHEPQISTAYQAPLTVQGDGLHTGV